MGCLSYSDFRIMAGVRLVSAAELVGVYGSCCRGLPEAWQCLRLLRRNACSGQNPSNAKRVVQSHIRANTFCKEAWVVTNELGV